MNLHMLSQLVQDLQKSIDEAQKIQTAVLRLHEEYGLDPRNPGASLEQQMSREEIAKAHAEVEADMHRMEGERIQSAPHAPAPRKAFNKARRNQSII